MSSIDLSENKSTYFDLLPEEIQDKIWKWVHQLCMADVKSELFSTWPWIQLHPFAGNMDCKLCRSIAAPCGECPQTCNKFIDVWLEI